MKRPKPITKYPAEIEVDATRGVIYVHLIRPRHVLEFNCHTAIRIQAKPDPTFPMDIIDPQFKRELEERINQKITAG